MEYYAAKQNNLYWYMYNMESSPWHIKTTKQPNNNNNDKTPEK